MFNIAVIGGSSVTDYYCNVAYEVGKLLAERGATVFCGGLSGVMECVAKGVKEKGGVIVGFLPGTSMMHGNEYLTVKIPTGIGYARNFLIIRASEVVIAIDGSSGTLSEASFAVTEGRSVVSIGDLELNHRKEKYGILYKVGTPTEAVDKAFEEAEKYRKSQEKRASYWDQFY